MNRIDRLLAYILLLETKKKIRAKDLAETFEISLRTVYRDIQALLEVGVPIVSLPGEGYQLMEGYYLPPVSFTPQEAKALFLGGGMLISHAKEDKNLKANIQSALRKIKAILPQESKEEVEKLQEIVSFYSFSRPGLKLDDPKWLILQEAIVKRHPVRLTYHSFTKDESTERVVEPFQLIHYDGRWHVLGFCRLRGQHRDFRLDRINKLTILQETFDRKINEEVNEELGSIEVKILFKPEILRWVWERLHFGYVDKKETSKGTIMSFRIRDFRQILSWILSWGEDAIVLYPESLCRIIQNKTQKILANYSTKNSNK
ncbi:MAG: helix-turn-helix transcriptional regulator [Candidatus Aminicenantia bacterium]